jgi:hypothetical protein
MSEIFLHDREIKRIAIAFSQNELMRIADTELDVMNVSSHTKERFKHHLIEIRRSLQSDKVSELCQYNTLHEMVNHFVGSDNQITIVKIRESNSRKRDGYTVTVKAGVDIKFDNNLHKTGPLKNGEYRFSETTHLYSFFVTDLRLIHNFIAPVDADGSHTISNASESNLPVQIFFSENNRPNNKNENTKESQ